MAIPYVFISENIVFCSEKFVYLIHDVLFSFISKKELVNKNLGVACSNNLYSGCFWSSSTHRLCKSITPQKRLFESSLGGETRAMEPAQINLNRQCLVF